MKNQTQVQWVKIQLKKYGYITRNQCLSRFISRLGAIICKLKNEGYQFNAYYAETHNGGNDYVYEINTK